MCHNKKQQQQQQQQLKTNTYRASSSSAFVSSSSSSSSITTITTITHNRGRDATHGGRERREAPQRVFPPPCLVSPPSTPPAYEMSIAFDPRRVHAHAKSYVIVLLASLYLFDVPFLAFGDCPFVLLSIQNIIHSLIYPDSHTGMHRHAEDGHTA